MAATSSPSAGAAAWAIAAAACVKLLLVPTYRSTDFDVHRYWLALTHALPAQQWYVDASSEWTLDYPPFFAYFSRLLALPAPLVDPSLVSIPVADNPPFAHLLYLRLTVAFSDRRVSNSPSGLPTVTPRPITTTRAPAISTS